MHIPFDNSYGRLPERFYARLPPTPVAAPQLVRLNESLAQELGLDAEALRSADGAAILSGNEVPPGADPIACAYAGHQFGHFVPQLGDGRAILLGEVVTPSGTRRDIQLKGSGRTPFSRGGDGRAALGPVLREYLVSEAMAALGIPTTRALAAITTGERVLRETVLPGAVLTRVAASHIRVGTFQFFAARSDLEALEALTGYAIARHYPAAANAGCPALGLLRAVAAAQAQLIARWLCVGFIHGVMNTDNCAISGETIDYGPCAFMDQYDPATVYSSIDEAGRYAFGNQPAIAQWNLARLAEALLPLMGEDIEASKAEAITVLDAFAEIFQTCWDEGLSRKIGLSSVRPGDRALAQELLRLMQEAQADYTLTFRNLASAVEADAPALHGWDEWTMRWRSRLAEEQRSPEDIRTAMNLANPAVIPRNHLVQRALDAAVQAADFAPFEELLCALSDPFQARSEGDIFTLPPRPEQRVLATFCGT